MKIVLKTVEYLVFVQDPNKPDRPSASHVTAIQYLDMEDGSPLRPMETVTMTPEQAAEAGLDVPEIAKQFASEDRIACMKLHEEAKELNSQLEAAGAVAQQIAAERDAAAKLAQQITAERDALAENLKQTEEKLAAAEQEKQRIIAAAQLVGLAAT